MCLRIILWRVRSNREEKNKLNNKNLRIRVSWQKTKASVIFITLHWCTVGIRIVSWLNIYCLSFVYKPVPMTILKQKLNVRDEISYFFNFDQCLDDFWWLCQRWEWIIIKNFTEFLLNFNFLRMFSTPICWSMLWLCNKMVLWLSSSHLRNLCWMLWKWT